MLSTKELAHELGVSEKTIRRYQEQNMPHELILGSNNRPQYRFDLNTCKAWIMARTRSTHKPPTQNTNQHQPEQNGLQGQKTPASSDALYQSLLNQISFLKEQIAIKDHIIHDLQKTINNLVSFNNNSLKQMPSAPPPTLLFSPIKKAPPHKNVGELNRDTRKNTPETPKPSLPPRAHQAQQQEIKHSTLSGKSTWTYSNVGRIIKESI